MSNQRTMFGVQESNQDRPRIDSKKRNEQSTIEPTRGRKSSFRHRKPSEADLLADTYRGHAYDLGELEWYTSWCKQLQASFGPREFGEVLSKEFSTRYMDIGATVPQTAAEREVRYSLCAELWLALEAARLVPPASDDFPPTRAQLPASTKRKSKF